MISQGGKGPLSEAFLGNQPVQVAPLPAASIKAPSTPMIVMPKPSGPMPFFEPAPQPIAGPASNTTGKSSRSWSNRGGLEL